MFYAHTISPIAIALLFTVILCLFIGSFHWALGLLALLAYAVVGVAVPLVASKASGDRGLCFREQSGELSSFVLESLRGLSEILQYGRGEDRLQEMNARTQALSREEERLKQVAGRNQAATNTCILLFDLLMLFAATGLYAAGEVSFAGVLLPTLALMSSFGPCVALAGLGSTLQHTFAAGNRVLDLLDESPVVEEIAGKPPTAFSGAAAKEVSFAYGEETILDGVDLDIPQGSVVGIVGKSGSGKSTLLKLFMRFWEADKGRVAVSGRKVGDINTADLRDMESFVTQDTHLFHAAYGRTCASPSWTPPRRSWKPPARRPRSMGLSRACPRATTPRWGSWGPPSPAGSASGWGWPGRSSTRGSSSCWTSPPATWTA